VANLEKNVNPDHCLATRCCLFKSRNMRSEMIFGYKKRDVLKLQHLPSWHGAACGFVIQGSLIILESLTAC